MKKYVAHFAKLPWGRGRGGLSIGGVPRFTGRTGEGYTPTGRGVESTEGISPTLRYTSEPFVALRGIYGGRQNKLKKFLRWFVSEKYFHFVLLNLFCLFLPLTAEKRDSHEYYTNCCYCKNYVS